MKKIKHLMIWIGLLLSLVSCKDTMEAIGLGGGDAFRSISSRAQLFFRKIGQINVQDKSQNK